MNVLMPDNNIKWQIGYTLQVWTYAAGKTLKYRLNVLAERVNQVCAVLTDMKKQTKQIKEDIFILNLMVDLLYSSHFPALETNPYIPHMRANFEKGLNHLDRKLWQVVNRENLASSSMMQEAMTGLGKEKRNLSKKSGGDAP